MQTKTSLIGYLLVLLIIPQIAFASWWNPSTWFSNWNFFKKETAKTHILENRIRELESKLGDATTTPNTRNTSLTRPTSTEEKIEVKRNTATTDNASVVREQVRLEVEASLKAKAEQEALIEKKRVEEQAKLELQKAEQERQAAQNAAIAAEQQAIQIRKQREEEQRQICLSAHYSRAQIQQVVDASINTLTSANENSKASIRNSYDLQIQRLRDDRQIELTSQLERGGGATGGYALDLFKKQTEAEVADLEARKAELLSQADSLLAQNISGVQIKALGLFQDSREAKCGI
jgi:hypothetical protein